MKLKFCKDHVVKNSDGTDQAFAAGDIGDITPDDVAQALIDALTAVLYTPEMEANDTAEAKAKAEKIFAESDECKAMIKEANKKEFHAPTKSTGANVEGKKMEVFTKAVEVLTKATTGAATLSPMESGTLITDIIDSPIIAQARQTQTEALTYNVLFDGSNGADDTDTVGYTSEATENEVTTPLKATKVNLGKVFGTVLVSNEIIRLQNGADASIASQMHNKAVRAIENGIFSGAFTGNAGFEGICVSAKSTPVTVTAIGTVEKDKISDLMSAVPDDDTNCFFCNSAYWRKLVAAFADADNLNGQNITDGMNKTLKGYKVFTSVNVPAATPLVYGSLQKSYELVNTGIEFDASNDAAFLKDAKAYRVRVFVGGAIASVAKIYDGVTYAPFAYIKQSE